MMKESLFRILHYTHCPLKVTYAARDGACILNGVGAWIFCADTLYCTLYSMLIETVFDKIQSLYTVLDSMLTESVLHVDEADILYSPSCSKATEPKF